MSSSSSGELKAVLFKPGIDKNKTSYENENTFIDGDKVRFRNGQPEKLTGWLETGSTQFDDPSVTTLTGTARASRAFVDLESNGYVAYGSDQKLELVLSNQIFDITPLTTVGTITSAISTSVGSTLLQVAFPGHNKQPGDRIILDGLASVGGIDTVGEFIVTTVEDSSLFYVETNTTATSTETSVGTSVELSFLYPVGAVDNDVAAGYGAGTWGTAGVSGYGEPRIDTVPIDMRLWTIDVWGEDILAVPRNGPLVHWDATNGVQSILVNRSDVRATIVPNAPDTNTLIFVSAPERHAVLLGTKDVITSVFDPLLVRWSDRENFNVWTPTSINAAGDMRLTGGSKIVGYVKTRRENLLFTDQTVVSMSYINAPFFYKFNSLSNNTGLIGQNAAVEVEGVVYWMGPNAFYRYDGVVKRLPCSLSDFIFKDDAVGSINRDQTDKIVAGVDSTYNEILWFYPSVNSVENDRYVIYNYEEDLWYDGTIVRTTWVPSGLLPKPQSTSRDNSDNSPIFTHDTGLNDGDDPMEAYIQSGFFDIADGEETMFVNQIIPDFTMEGNLKITLKARRQPFDQNVETKGPYLFNKTTRKIPVRIRGREVSLLVESSDLNSNFRLGKIRFNPLQDGKR